MTPGWHFWVLGWLQRTLAGIFGYRAVSRGPWLAFLGTRLALEAPELAFLGTGLALEDPG